ncbi:MAG: type I-C CRISPR-associated protein Cas5 [Desulfamplus sp.]|nr:type I-C CRISPR-associated protein Cas5 [Desulfamplus sp.]
MGKEKQEKWFCLDVWGDYACFTRPEMKVERVSYDVITPSAARAIFEAILWKPAIRWHIRQIEVINPIKWVSVRRNEVGALMSERSKNGIIIEESRQQKAGLFLKDVRYRLHAYLEFLPLDRRNTIYNPLPEYLIDSDEKNLIRQDETAGKYLAMFERRAKKGQCFNQPYFGCREFSCHFRLVEKSELKFEDADSLFNEHDFISEPEPWQHSMNLGFMLYDLDFQSNDKEPPAAFYRPEMINGVINVPDWDSKEVYR